MIIWPGLRRSVSAIQRLFNSASFYAPLTHSLVPERGTGSPTFTRASTATVTNNDGYLVTALAGEARFVGARRVRNLLGNTENLLGAGWTAVGGAPVQNVVAPDGTTTGWSKAVAGVGDEIRYLTTYDPAGKAGLGSVWLKGSGTISIRISNNVDQQFVTQFTLSSEWTRFSTDVNTANTASGVWLFGIFYNTGDTATSVDVWHPQLEDVTAQTTQTAGEYVSVGVLSAPYHGAGVDGVKYFNTDIAGNPISPSGILMEGSRENLCLQSQTFATTWTKVNAGDTVTSDSVVAPDGTTTADTLTGAAVNIQKGLTQGFSNFATGTPLTFSVYLKYSTQQFVQFLTNTGADGYANFDLVNGTTSSSTATSQIVAMSNGWYRCSITVTCSGATTNWYILFANSLASTRYEATTSVGVLPMWGAQYETGSFASTYIPTTTAAVTRAADADATPTASNILAAASTVYLEFTPDHTPSGTIALWGTYVDASNYTAILHDATNMIMRKRIAGMNYDATIANAFTANTTYKVCGSWGASGVTVTVDGTEGTPDANTTAAQIAATMQWGADGNSLQQPFATERNARVWQRQLSASERGAVTS